MENNKNSTSLPKNGTNRKKILENTYFGQITILKKLELETSPKGKGSAIVEQFLFFLYF